MGLLIESLLIRQWLINSLTLINAKLATTHFYYSFCLFAIFVALIFVIIAYLLTCLLIIYLLSMLM